MVRLLQLAGIFVGELSVLSGFFRLIRHQTRFRLPFYFCTTNRLFIERQHQVGVDITSYTDAKGKLQRGKKDQDASYNQRCSVELQREEQDEDQGHYKSHAGGKDLRRFVDRLFTKLNESGHFFAEEAYRTAFGIGESPDKKVDHQENGQKYGVEEEAGHYQ